MKLVTSKAQFDKISGEAGEGLVAVQISTKTCGPCKAGAYTRPLLSST